MALKQWFIRIKCTLFFFLHSCHKFYNIIRKKNYVLELYVCAERKNKLYAHKQKCINSECIAYLHLCVKMLFTFLQLPTYILRKHYNNGFIQNMGKLICIQIWNLALIKKKEKWLLHVIRVYMLYCQKPVLNKIWKKKSFK